MEDHQVNSEGGMRGERSRLARRVHLFLRSDACSQNAPADHLASAHMKRHVAHSATLARA